MAAADDAETFRQAGVAGIGEYTHLASQTLEDLAENITLYRRSLPVRQLGEVAFLLHTFVAQTDEVAWAIARKPLQEYILKFLKSSPTGVSCRMDLNPRLLAEVATERLRGRSPIGCSATCSKLLQQLEAIGVDEVVCLFDFGVDEDVIFDHLSYLQSIRTQ